MLNIRLYRGLFEESPILTNTQTTHNVSVDHFSVFVEITWWYKGKDHAGPPERGTGHWANGEQKNTITKR